MDDTALMIFTSGSTGRPKAAMISYGNIAAMAAGTDAMLPLHAGRFHRVVPAAVPRGRADLHACTCRCAAARWSTSPRACARCRPTCARSRRRCSWACRASGKSCTPRSRSRSARPAGCGASCTSVRWRPRCASADLPPEERSTTQQLSHAFWHVLVLRALINFIGLRRCRWPCRARHRSRRRCCTSSAPWACRSARATA